MNQQQMSLFEADSVASSPPPGRRKKKRRSPLVGTQLPLLIPHAEPMAIGYCPDAHPIPIGTEVEFQTLTGGTWYRGIVVDYTAWGAAITQRHSDGYRHHCYPQYLRKAHD